MDRYYEAALAFAKENGWDRDELPPGDRGECWTCPLGLAVPGFHQGDGFNTYLHIPPDVYTFILRFDGGEYPDLIADKD